MRVGKQIKTIAISICIGGSIISSEGASEGPNITGELKKWHNVMFTFDGPSASETGKTNPFTDYRFNVTFTNGNKKYVVPGYFAADGNAANTSATSGNKWRVHFAPDATGKWTYHTSFRTGNNVALSLNAKAGSPVASLNDKTGTFSIAPTNKSGRDLRGKGRLQYVNDHFLRFAETGEYFLKAGPDSPENFLAYDDIDGTPNNEITKDPFRGKHRKSWKQHQRDYKPGDPSWKNGKGTEIMGAINYLASEGLNVFSFLTFNVNGDDKNVFPHVSDRNFKSFDCSKLDQWGMIFSHAQKKGMYLHFKLGECETERVLDGTYFGNERKLYYREMIARFGHNLALNWNLGEEVGNWNQPHSAREQMVAYISSVDPYHHNLLVQTDGYDEHHAFRDLLGNPMITGASIKSSPLTSSHKFAVDWVKKSADAGKKWVVSVDEQNPANTGVPPDSYTGRGDKHDIRKDVLWGTYMGGGAGVEYYFGYGYAHHDINCNDFRSRGITWDYCRHALNFFNKYVPFWKMKNADSIVSSKNAYALKKDDEVYVVYLRNGGSTTVDLAKGKTYTIKWYDPKNGGNLKDGNVRTVQGGFNKSIGNAPSNRDWVALIRKKGYVHQGNGGGSTPVDPVGKDVTGVTVSPSTLSMTPGTSSTLLSVVVPSTASNKTITWQSNNTAVATINAQGVIKAVSSGTAEIRVKTNDGGFVAHCQVTVRDVNDTITSYTAPATIEPSETVAVTVNYQTSAVRALHVRLQSTTSWNYFGEAVKSINGSGKVTLNFTSRNNPDANDSYRWVMYLTDSGGDIVGSKTFKPVDVHDTTSNVSTKTIQLTPVADAFLQNGWRNNTSDLKVENGRRVSYLKFDLESITGTIESMTLNLTVGSDAGHGKIIVAKGTHSNWTESNLSKNNAPGAGTSLATTTGSLAKGKKVTYNVTNAGTGRYVTFVVSMAPGGNDVAFASKESPKNKPQLVVKYTTAASKSESNVDTDTSEKDSTGDSDSTSNSLAMNIPFEKTIALRAQANNKYVCAEGNAHRTLLANRTTVDLWEKFILKDAGGGYVYLIALANKKFVRADKNSNSQYALVATGTHVGDAEKFTFIRNSDNTVSLKSKASGKYISSDMGLNSTNSPLTANRSAIGKWEKFTCEIK